MAKMIPIPFNDFTGGEASIFPLSNMKPKYSVKMQNCHLSERGTLAKIPGYVKYNSTQEAETFTSGYEFVQSDGTKEKLVAGGGKIYKATGGTLTEIKSGLDTNAKVDFATMNDLCIMVNGVDAPMKYDGTTVSALGGSPPATAFRVHTHKGRLWLLEKDNKLLATHSALDDPEDFTTIADAGYLDFKFVLSQGDELLDIATYVDLQIFFFRSQIAIYSGSDPTSSGDYALVQLIQGSGVVSSDVVQGLGTDMAFLYDSGVKSLKQVVTTGSLNIDDPSEVIDPTLRLEMAGVSIFSSAHYPKLGWLMVLINDKVWLFSYTWKAWARMVGADVKGMFSTTDGKVYFCGTGFLYEYGSTWTFADVNPVMVWETAWWRLSKSGRTMYPKFIELILYPQATTTIDIETRFDQSTTMGENVQSIVTEPSNINVIDDVTDWDALDPMDEIQHDMPRVPIFGGGKTMQHILKNISDQPVEVSEIMLHVTPGGM